MKRKLHPNRRNGRRHVSSALRHEYRMEGYFGGFNRSPKQKWVFVRAPRRCGLAGLTAAGYRFASLNKGSDWSDVHKWLAENCTTPYGKQYTWFGGTFVFARNEDHAAFIRQFDCADEYKPMFAFEVGR